MISKPFIKKIISDGEYYIYDVNRNAILQTDYQFFNWIDEQTTPHCDNQHCLTNFEKMKNKGFFSSNRPEITYFHNSDEATFMEELTYTLEKNLNRITLVVSEDCNLRCKYCAYSGAYSYHRKHSYKKMSQRVMKAAVDFYLSHSSENPEKRISFYGGEPLTHFELIRECVQYIESIQTRPVAYNMTINGTLLTPAIIEFLVAHSFTLLISIDGPRDIHDRNRVFANGRGSFNSIYQNLKIFKQMYPEYYSQHVRFNVVVSPPFEPHEIKKLFYDPEIQPMGVRFSSVRANNTSFFEGFSSTQLEEYQYQRGKFLDSFNTQLLNNEAFDSISRAFFSQLYYAIHQRSMDLLPSKYPAQGQCMIGARALQVDVDGNFNFCTQVEDVFNLGNVFAGFNLPYIKQIYLDLEQLYKEHCYDCWALRFCSKCIKDVNDNGKISISKLQTLCPIIKKGLTQEIMDYIRIRKHNPQAFSYLDHYTIT